MYNLLQQIIFMDIHVKPWKGKGKKLFLCSAWGKRKSVDEWKEIWLEAKKGSTLCKKTALDFLELYWKRRKEYSKVSAPSLVPLSL